MSDTPRQLDRSRSRLAGLVMGCAAAACAAGCHTLDVAEPIVLVADSGWTELEVQTLSHAADCWNAQFGTPLAVGHSGEAFQEVRVGYSDFVCTYAAGRTETTLPVRVLVCPTKYTLRWSEDKERALFFILLHELGHVLNIRSHADDLEAVMNAGDNPELSAGYLPAGFAAEDAELFGEANPGFVGDPACAEVSIEREQRPPRCSCARRR